MGGSTQRIALDGENWYEVLHGRRIITPDREGRISRISFTSIRAIQVLRNADGMGGVKFSRKNHYEGVTFNVI